MIGYLQHVTRTESDGRKHLYDSLVETPDGPKEMLVEARTMREALQLLRSYYRSKGIELRPQRTKVEAA